MWQNLFYPKYLKWRWAFCISIGVYLHLFTTFCEPFKDQRITYMWASYAAYLQHSLFNFILTVLCCALPLIFLPHYCPNYISPKTLTFKRFSLWVAITAFIIEIGYFGGNYAFFHHELSLFWFLTFIFKITCTSFLFIGLPFLFVFILIFNHFTNSKNQTLTLLDASLLDNSKPSDLEENGIKSTDRIPPQYEAEQSPIVLHFNDVSNKKQLDVSLDKLYYITSAQNYIEIFYKDANEKLTKQLLRTTLKTIEEDWAIHADLPLVRCHKAFIVNFDKVLELQGTSKNAQFILDEIDTKIPVSRHKFADFEEKLTQSSQSI